MSLAATEGYTYDLSWSSARIPTTTDTTSGLPGNVTISFALEAEVTLTNTTPGKKAPYPQVLLVPVFSSNPCALTVKGYLPAQRVEPCSSITFDGVPGVDQAEYWLIDMEYTGYTRSMDRGVRAGSYLEVGEQVDYSDKPGASQISWEVSEGNANALKALIAAPDFWIATADEDDGFACPATYSANFSHCVEGSSDNIQW